MRVLIALTLVLPVAAKAQAPDAERLRQLLTAGQHATLEGELERWRDASTVDLGAEEHLHDAFSAFAIPAAAVGDEIDAWARARSGPYASLARAFHVEARAREADGDEMEALLLRARGDAEKALVQAPDLGVARAILIAIEAPLGNRGSIDRHVTEAIADRPATFVVRRAHVASLAPRWGGNYGKMRAAAAVDPALEEANPALARLAGIADFDRANVSAQRGALKRAVVLYGQALEQGADADVLAARATTYLRDGRPELALADAEAALELRPGMVRAMRDRGIALYESGQVEKGLTVLDRADALDPDNPHSARWREHWASGQVRAAGRTYASKSYEEALELYDQALRLDPADASAHHGRALTLEQLGRMDEAIEALEQSLALDPRALETYITLDRLLTQRAAWSRLVREWGRLAALDSRNGRAFAERAHAHYQNGNRRRAIQDAERACGLGEPMGCNFLRRHAGD